MKYLNAFYLHLLYKFSKHAWNANMKLNDVRIKKLYIQPYTRWYNTKILNQYGWDVDMISNEYNKL